MKFKKSKKEQAAPQVRFGVSIRESTVQYIDKKASEESRSRSNMIEVMALFYKENKK